MNDQKISSKTESRDPKVLKTFEIVQTLKATEPTLAEVTKAAAKYVELMVKLCDAGKVLAAVLSGLADQHGGDLGDGIRTSSDLLKQLEAKRSKQIQTILDNVVDPYTKGEHRPDQNKMETNNFEKKFKNDRTASMKQIKKGETNSRKLAKKKKKDQRQLDEALAALSKSVEAHDVMLADALREAVILDRHRFCAYISAWNAVLLGESEVFDAGFKLLAEKMPDLQALADDTAESIPEEVVQLIKESRPEAALKQLEKVRETGYFPAGLDLGGDDDPSSGSTVVVDDDDPLGAHAVQPYKVRVKQRYDAQNPDELSLVLGDIFDVTAEIDENWAVAEVHGKRGMFPSNHVEKMRRAGS